MQLVVFRLEDHQYALPLPAVERIVHAVEVTPLPGAPATVMGAIRVEGKILPVFNIRRRLGLPEREVGLADWFLIAKSGDRDVVIIVDGASGVIDRPDGAIRDPNEVGEQLDQYHGITDLDGGIVLIYNLEQFLSAAEASALDRAVEGG